MEAAQQAYEVDRNRVTRAVDFVNEPRFATMDEHQLRERLARLTEAFEGADRNYRILANGEQDQARRMGLDAAFDELEDRYTDAVAGYKRRMLELVPPPAAAPVALNAAAPQAPPPAAADVNVNVNMPFQPSQITRTWTVLMATH